MCFFCVCFFFIVPECPTTSSKLLPLQLAIVGPSPFVEAIDLLCSYKNAVNFCLEASKWVHFFSLYFVLHSNHKIKKKKAKKMKLLCIRELPLI